MFEEDTVRPPPLTPKIERRVTALKTVTWDADRAVRLAAEGKTYVQIGEMLGVSGSAVGAYFRRIGKSVRKGRNEEPVQNEKMSAAPAHTIESVDARPAVAAPEALPAKPPLGVMPQWLWTANRVNELAGAIGRYIETRMRVPPEWLEEYNGLLADEAGARNG